MKSKVVPFTLQLMIQWYENYIFGFSVKSKTILLVNWWQYLSFYDLVFAFRLLFSTGHEMNICWIGKVSQALRDYKSYFELGPIYLREIFEP